MLCEPTFSLIGRWTLIPKMVQREVFLMKPKHQFIYRNEANVFMVPSYKKKKRLPCESMFVTIGKWPLTLNNDGNRRLSYEAKASMSFIPMRRMSLSCPIKKKKITMWIHVCRNWQMNFNSKQWWKEKLFLWNKSINVICPNEENEFMVPNHEKKGYY